MNEGKTTYSQSGEDILIDFIFNTLQIETRRYLDIGTNDPVHLNNSYLFYRQGATGVCVEPDPDLCMLIKTKRPHDIVVSAGIGARKGKLDLYLMEPHTLNTFSKKEAQAYRQHYPWTSVRKVVKVKLLTINDILKKYFKAGIDLLSVDAEGLDQQIIESLDFPKYLPTVICVETAIYMSEKTLGKNSSIINFLKRKGYFVYAETFVNTIFVDYQAWLNHNGPKLKGY